jgi:hypothetical protein
MFVVFEAQDISWHPVNTDPPFLGVFTASDRSRFEYAIASSAVPTTLQPGQSAAVAMEFDTGEITGQFSLIENTQLGQVIVSTTLHRISAGSR